MRKILNIVAYCILAAMVITIIGLSAGVKAKNKKLKEAKAEIELLKADNTRLAELTEKLAQMDAVHCDVTIMVKNTAVMGSVQSGDLNAQIEQIATYTRGEILKMKQDTTYGTVRPKE